MKSAKSLVHCFVLLFALVSCSVNVETPTRPGTGTGPAEPAPGKGGPYLNYFSSLNLTTGDGILHMLASTTANADSTPYDIAVAQNQDQLPLPAAAMINRKSIVKSYTGRPLFETLRSINLTLQEMFYIDSGKLYRTDVHVAGRLLQVEVSSKTDFSTICDQTNGAFLNLVTAIFFYELPGADNDCSVRGDNTIIRVSENDINTTAPLDITAGLKATGVNTLPLLKNIVRIIKGTGDVVIDGYLVLNGTTLSRFDADFSGFTPVTLPALTTIELGSGGMGLAQGAIHYVTIDGAVYNYDVNSSMLDTATVLYTPETASTTIVANVCKKEECLFVTKDAAKIDLHVIQQDGTKQSKKLIANMENAISSVVFDTVNTMVRNTNTIYFTANKPTDPGTTSLIKIDLGLALASLSAESKFELHLGTTVLIPEMFSEFDTGSPIDLFLTNGVVYYNKNYTRLHDYVETTNPSQAIVITPETRTEFIPVDPIENDRTIYKTSAWVGVIDTEVSRQIVIERIILAQTKNKLDTAGNELNEPETSLTAYNTANHSVSASLGLIPPEVDVVHMSFKIVGNMGLGDAFIAKTSPLANLTDSTLLQSDIYYIDTVKADSLLRITSTPADEESAFSSCANAGSLYCR